MATGALNLISGSGVQNNFNQSGGSNNQQYNAETMHFYARDAALTQEECQRALLLTPPEIDRENLISAKGRRVDGTCAWITRDKSYISWLHGDINLLWICGWPGKGKTMLSIFLTQELERDGQTIYYFCSAEDDKRNSATCVLRGLLWQLTMKHPELVEHLLHFLEDDAMAKNALSSRETLWTIFVKLLADPRLQKTSCLLDGLDECDTDSKEWLATRLVGLMMEGYKGAFRILLVSRDILQLRAAKQVKLDYGSYQDTDSDIRSFVRVRVQELSHRPWFAEDHQSQVEDILIQRAERTFLWVGFAMTELSRKKTWSEVKSTLRVLPKGLFPIYNRMLSQVEPTEKEMSARILRWVVLAVRPLSVLELGAAVGCCSSSLGLEQATRDQISICEPFVRVTDQGVGLVHKSARDYLLRSEKGEVAALEEYRVKSAEGHLEISQTCLDSIAHSPPQQKNVWAIKIDLAEIQKDLLLIYAVSYWPEHARRTTCMEQLMDQSSSFFAKSSAVRDNWWTMFRGRSLSNGTYDDDYDELMPPLHMACSLGLVHWARRLLTENSKRTFAGRGTVSLLRQLLRADVDLGTKTGFTALHYAAQKGHLDIVRLLLDYRASIDIKTTDSKSTPLHFAASHGHAGIVSLLLEHGASINRRDAYGILALDYAVGIGELDVVRVLLKCQTRADTGTTLGIAAMLEDANMVWCLLQHGARVNVQDVHGNTALHSATRVGNEDVARMLLKHGARVDLQNADGESALHVAAGLTGRLLLQHGAAVNIVDKKGWTSLHRAAWCSNSRVQARSTATMRLLLQHGADPKMKSKTGNTASGLVPDDQPELKRLIEEWPFSR